MFSFSPRREMKEPRSALRGTSATRCRENRAKRSRARLDWGPSYSNQEIKQVLENCKARYRFHVADEQRLEETIQLLAAGKIVGWFHGAAEFGPRALGNRSLLASPWAAYVKENLNEFVKHREAFRPFAISVPAERAAEYFEYSPPARFMATLGIARPEADQLARRNFCSRAGAFACTSWSAMQTRFFGGCSSDLASFAPAPMLVNTSFNLFGEPLVVSPRDAVRSYFCSGVDALGDRRVFRWRRPRPGTRPKSTMEITFCCVAEWARMVCPS